MIEKIKEVAKNNGFVAVNNVFSINGRQAFALKKSASFALSSVKFFEPIDYYLLIDEENAKAYLCFNSKLARTVFADCNEGFIEEIADLATTVVDSCANISREIKGDFGENPLTAEIDEVDLLEDLIWFDRIVVSYHTLCKLIFEGRWSK